MCWKICTLALSSGKMRRISQLLPAVAIVVRLSLCSKGFQVPVSYQTSKSIFFYRQSEHEIRNGDQKTKTIVI